MIFIPAQVCKLYEASVFFVMNRLPMNNNQVYNGGDI